ncbi:hypothetical protein V6N11_039261 [Hibiscus sabdariffa]|uniref:Uncharacterized protein n=1 Tax=Hibiscus sabdariffa TaxID=183260 RepID=A0ABR2SN45_9ROSI
MKIENAKTTKTVKMATRHQEPSFPNDSWCCKRITTSFRTKRRKKKRLARFQNPIDDDQAAIPPPNAVLLMRCRSAPAKARQEENEENEEDAKDDSKRKYENKTTNLKPLMEEENRKAIESLVAMGYDCDSYKISTNMFKETWLVGGMKDPLS